MNVTDRGYYTSTYLDTVNRHKSPRHDRSRRRKDDKALLQMPSSNTLQGKEYVTPQLPQTIEFESSPKSRITSDQQTMPISPETQYTTSTGNDTIDTEDVSFDPDDLHEQITPAQLNILQKRYRSAPGNHRRRRARSYDEHDYSRYDDESGYDYDSRYEPSQYDDSRYDESMYDDYYNENTRVRLPNRGAQRQRPRRQERDHNGYYIQQKKRYDEAEFYKPKNYTHKTFRDVFNDNDEELGKYNPMEIVFDDPEKLKEQEQNQKVKRALKNLQVKLGKDDYANYDYYVNKNKTTNATNDVFVAGDESDDSDYDVKPQEDTEKNKPKKKVNLKKLWKSKTKQIKKELGRDYFNNMEKQWVLEEEKKQKKLEDEARKELEQEMVEGESVQEIANDPIIEEPGTPLVAGTSAAVDAKNGGFYAGPKPDFHPAWNYVLSWLTYEQPKVDTPVDVGPVDIHGDVATIGTSAKDLVPKETEAKSMVKLNKSVPIVKPPQKKRVQRIKVTGEQLRNFNKNVGKLKNMWNLPASNLFNGQTQNNAPGKGTSIKDLQPDSTTLGSLPQSGFEMPFDGNSQEFVIELEDDDDSMVEELFFNPMTGQLEREPPTSYSSMDYAQSPTMNSFKTQKLIQLGGSTLLLHTSEGPRAIISNINKMIKSIKLMKIVFAPIDVIAESFPNLQTLVIMVELIIFMWILYELSLLIDALCMMVKAVCAPMIAMGRFMNRIM